MASILNNELSHTDSVAHYRIKKVIRLIEEEKEHNSTILLAAIPPHKYIDLKEILNNTNKDISDTLRKQLAAYTIGPSNGLIVYANNRYAAAIEPPIPIKQIECNLIDLKHLIKDQRSFGIVVIGTKITSLTIIQGEHKTIIDELKFEEVKKRLRGGSSSVRFARLVAEKRVTFGSGIRKAINAKFMFNGKPIVFGLVFVYSGDFYDSFLKIGDIDEQLRNIIITVINGNKLVSAGKPLYDYAIEFLNTAFERLKIIREYGMILKLLKNHKVVFGLNNVIKMLEEGSLSKIIAQDNIKRFRVLLKDNNVRYLEHITEGMEGMESIESIELDEWLIEKCKQLKVELHFVSCGVQENL